MESDYNFKGSATPQITPRVSVTEPTDAASPSTPRPSVISKGARFSVVSKTSSKTRRNVPHTYLTLPNGQQMLFSLPVSIKNTRGTYGDNVETTLIKEKVLPNSVISNNYGFSGASIKFFIAGVIICTISVLFFFCADDASANAKLVVLLVGCGLACFVLLCSNSYICSCSHPVPTVRMA